MAFLLLLVVCFLVLLPVPATARLRFLEGVRAKAAVAMGIGFVVTGVMHFTGPDRFLAMMPQWLPWHLELVYLSGVAEILCAAGLVVPQTRRIAGWCAMALLLAIFPANIHVAVSGGMVEGLPQDGWYYWLRLPLQLVYIAWAWWSSKDSE
ncbi:MAG: DoxX family protein [bacterium]|nr:DoxX family protein [bacterium]